MEKKMTFNYFYGTEADQFSFYPYQKHYLQTVILKIYRAMLKFYMD